MGRKEERCCGNCCWFKHEDMDGWGICYRRLYPDQTAYCGNKKCKARGGNEFVSNELMRHHMAVLLQANRYRRDRNVPAIYKMPNPKEYGAAIDFAVSYMKTFKDI